MMKKAFLTTLFLLAIGTGSMAQSWGVDDMIRKIPVTSPPTSDPDKQNRLWIEVPPQYRKFSTVVYRDFQCTQPKIFSDPEKVVECCAIFQFRKPENNNYTVLGMTIGDGDAHRHILVTYDLSANQIDWIEVNVAFSTIPLKQYQITPDMKLYVYELKPTSTTPLYYFEDFIMKKANSLPAQRIDAVYQIGDDGKITKLSEKKYKPQTYQLTALKGATISAGSEVPLP